MSKLTVELICQKAPGSDENTGLNERKANDQQYFLDQKLLKIYLGEKEKLSQDLIREKVSEADWQNISETEIELDIGELNTEQSEAAYEMISLKSFVFDKYKSSKEARQVQVKRIAFKPKKPDGFNTQKRDEIINSVKFCRDIVSSNADEINPEQMQKFAENITAQSKRIKCKVIDAEKAKKMGMNCLLAVGAESLANSKPEFHPRLVVIEYTGAKYKANSGKHLSLVGKGITYDTGGLCLKPTKYMLDMKSDMAGAAAVLSVFHGLANLSEDIAEDIKITGVLALSENGFGASSYKPGDVLKAMNGTTVEVVDTDAEGRLALADALSYVSSLKDKANKVIDLATLTGSIVATLGEVAAGAMGDEQLFKEINTSFAAEGEKIWRMPLHPQYKDILKSTIADIKHCNTRPDALCAGIFLKEFVDKDSQWLHLDIAGMGFIEEDGLWAYKGATGFAVKGLLRYLLDV